MRVLTLTLLFVAALSVGGVVAADAGTATPVVDATNHTDDGPPDPEEDRLGWESVDGHGLWYNESITVTRSDGLNDTELDKVVARGMARVEQIRRLEFREEVPVRVISREQHFEETLSRFENTSTNDSLHQNVKFESLFFVGENTDTIAEQRKFFSNAVLGYYSPEGDNVTIVSENTTTPQIDEITLSQELFHALQDQIWNISSYERRTEEENNAINGIIEGDGNYVDFLYNGRCQTSWDCLLPQGERGGGGDVNVGISLLGFQPYSDGPSFVQGLRQNGDGWSAVNEVYENPPQSSEQVIHPNKYREDAPTEVTVADRSNDRWRIPDLGSDSIDYAQFGEAGIYTMFAYPTFADRTPVIVGRSDFVSGSELDPYNYDTEASAGWDGDKLYPYVTEESNTTNETGYVWKTVWDSPGDATEFADAYLEILEFHGAEAVGNRESTYRISEAADEDFADAFYLNETGTTVTIVNAPTVEELSGVRAGAAPEIQTTTPTPTPTTAGPTDTTATVDATTTDAADDTADGNATDAEDDPAQPGFGLAVAALALVAVVALLARRD